MEMEGLCSDAVALESVLYTMMEAVAVETALVSSKYLAWVLFASGYMPSETADALPNVRGINPMCFPFPQLNKVTRTVDENMDASETDEEDNDDDGDSDDDDDDSDDSDDDSDDGYYDSSEEGSDDDEDPEDGLQANGGGGSDDDDDGDDEDEEDDDEDEEEEEDEEEQAQPPFKKMK
ncbi:phosphopantothenoylcysteine decarboxylase subunit VHS3-like [Malania oleifera]|uniref:phosphopantothenoylcysteine decarboxylase subunit VHS3-like n=1 Tax=Malania oleifera TaxID=397392 RepID=UPI0025ADC235|nr:phosphopantothenoylcysteine decarboxylase subunit VHS3-like [Malania oleifera]